MKRQEPVMSSQPYALVLSDIRMSQINGIELLGHLSRSYPDIAVIMITAENDAETAVHVMQQGATDYIVKPFNLQQVLAKVRKALRQRLLLLEDKKAIESMEHLLRRKSFLEPPDRVSSLRPAPLTRQPPTSASEMKPGTTQRKLAAIMFTDIVGYTALMQTSEDLALELLGKHRSMLRSILPNFDGREVKTMGDGFLVEFSSALSATRCAIAIQKRLVDRNSTVPPQEWIEIRIGLHLGDVICRNGDLYGDGVNIASRIEALADTNGICVSEDLAHQIHNKIKEPVVSLGKTLLKNIQAPIGICKIVMPWETADGIRNRRDSRRIPDTNPSDRSGCS